MAIAYSSAERIAQPPIFKTMTQSNPRLWKLSDEIQDLENAIANLVDDETLTESDREIKLQQTFATWLSRGESFKTKAEQVARYIKHQEAITLRVPYGSPKPEKQKPDELEN
jgi:hypothetical protein